MCIWRLMITVTVLAAFGAASVHAEECQSGRGEYQR